MEDEGVVSRDERRSRRRRTLERSSIESRARETALHPTQSPNTPFPILPSSFVSTRHHGSTAHGRHGRESAQRGQRSVDSGQCSCESESVCEGQRASVERWGLAGLVVGCGSLLGAAGGGESGNRAVRGGFVSVSFVFVCTSGRVALTAHNLSPQPSTLSPQHSAVSNQPFRGSHSDSGTQRTVYGYGHSADTTKAAAGSNSSTRGYRCARLTISGVNRLARTQASHGYTTRRAACGQIRGESGGAVSRRLATSSFVVELRGGFPRLPVHSPSSRGRIDRFGLSLAYSVCASGSPSSIYGRTKYLSTESNPLSGRSFADRLLTGAEHSREESSERIKCKGYILVRSREDTSRK